MPIQLENVGIAIRDFEATIAFVIDLGPTVLGRDEASGCRGAPDRRGRTERVHRSARR